MPLSVLPLDSMDERHPGLTPALAASNLEAARVCLDRHHLSPTEFTLENEDGITHVAVVWDRPDDRCWRAWANEIDTTEAGASACVIAAVELLKGLVAIRRAETRTGADYYIALPGQSIDDLEDALRLEVSGTDRGSKEVVARRLTQKVEQAMRGNSNLPAVAGVVGFQAQLIALHAVEVIP